MEDVRPYYTLLRITPEAGQEEVEEAYHRLIIDLKGKISAGEAPAPEIFEDIRTAYATLRDPQRRAAYDAEQTLRPAQPTQQSLSSPSAPPPSSTQAGRAADNERSLQFSFQGQGGEYFRIWIVNLFLSIITLGIYSAWAKVRREQYFHRNLVLDGAGFDYHALPLSILKGRLIAVALFGLVTATQYIHPLLHVLVLVLGGFAVPWFLVRAFRFRAYNSSYRGLRFAFRGDTSGAFSAYIGYGLLVLITLGICTPLWIRETRKYMINNLHYGHGQFHCELKAAEIYGFILKASLVVFVAAAACGIIASLHVALALFAGAITVIVYLGMYPYIQMCLYNYVWNRTTLEGHRFFSNLSFKPYFGIVLCNMLFTVLTLGLYWPWAKVNLARYRASCTGILVAGGLDHFMAAAAEHTAAFGDEAADMFDLDIAL